MVYCDLTSGMNLSLRLHKPDMAPGDITSLLVEWANGDDQALERLTPILFT